MLQTIESTINEYYKKDKSNSSSNDSTDSIKRRRETNRERDADFTKSTGRSKKRVAKGQNKSAELSNYIEPDNCKQSIDDDPDFYDCDFDINGSEITDQNIDGRVLPSWSEPGFRVHV